MTAINNKTQKTVSANCGENIELYENKELNLSIRSTVINDEPWFIAKDVCDALGLKNNTSMGMLDEDEKADTHTMGVSLNGTIQRRTVSIISESGLYTLILRSRKPEARKFRKWVTSEVLPAIRRHGIYASQSSIEQMLANPETMIRTLTALRDEQARNEELLAQTESLSQSLLEAAPKLRFADAVAASEATCLIGELAKIMRQNGVDIGQNRLFEWLRVNHYLIGSPGERYNLPTQKAMESELFRIKKTCILKPNGVTAIVRTVKVTGKGQQFFIDKFLNEEGAASVFDDQQ